MTKAYTMNDTVDPDVWVVWDEASEEWEQARLARNPDRAEPLLIGLNGKRYRIGDSTRCQTLESFFREGDLTQIPHKWRMDETAWAPTLAEGERMGTGFQVRDWGKVR